MSNWPEAGFTPATTKQLQEFAGVQIGPESGLLLEELLLEEETPDELDDELLLEEDDELNDEELLDEEDQLLEDELDDIAALLPNHSLNSFSAIHPAPFIHDKLK